MPTANVVPTGDWIQTFTGGKFHPLSPVASAVRIEDIAHALANQCRFAGHVRDFYSVAQHCVLVSHYCLPTDALWGLLHDAPEAYICDLPRPVKYDPRMAVFKEVEKEIELAVVERFGLILPEPPSVKLADRRLLFTERRDLLPHLPWDSDGWGMGLEGTPLDETIVPWLPRDAERRFLDRYEELTNARR